MSAKPRMAGFFDNGTEVAGRNGYQGGAWISRLPAGLLSPQGEYARVGALRECDTTGAGPWRRETGNMAIRGMATVRQSITALYEESERSAIDGPPMLAVIDSEPPAPLSIDEHEIEMNEKPTIAARFDELRASGRPGDADRPKCADRAGPRA